MSGRAVWGGGAGTGVSGSSSIGGAGTARTVGSGDTGPPAASSFSMCTISRLRNWKASA